MHELTGSGVRAIGALTSPLKIVKKRSFHQDTALVRDIRLEREAALAQQTSES
jgi:hypothetical protein